MKVKRIVPLQDRVVVERVEHEDVSEYITTTDKAKEAPTQGVVIAVGPGKMREDGTLIPCAVSVGDTVLFAKYGGTDIDLGPGQEYTILREDEIMGKVEEVEEEIDVNLPGPL